MPFDREIHFGYVGPTQVWDFASRIGANIIDDSTRTTRIITEADFRTKPQRAQLDPAVCTKYKPLLRKAYCNTILAQGWQIIPAKNIANKQGPHCKDHIYVNCPWGIREARLWDIDIYFDPHEVGDGVEEVTLGVNLSGRYFPTMLDMKDPYGAMGSIILFNQTLMDQIAICKRELIAAIPEMQDAEVYVKEIFY